MGVPGCPEPAFSTASMDSVRMVLMQSRSRSAAAAARAGALMAPPNLAREARAGDGPGSPPHRRAAPGEPGAERREDDQVALGDPLFAQRLAQRDRERRR